MALFGMVYKGAMLLGGFGVMLGGLISSWMMASLIELSGFVGMIMFYAILAQLEERKVKAEVSHKASSASVSV